MARRRHGFTDTKFRWPREAASFVLTDCRKLGVHLRQGANHTGIAVTSECWFYNDAGLLKNTPAKATPCRPDEAATPSRSPSRAGPMQLQYRYINAVKTNEARRRGRTWPAQSHVLSGTCTDEDTGFAATHTHHTHTPASSCVENSKRR